MTSYDFHFNYKKANRATLAGFIVDLREKHLFKKTQKRTSLANILRTIYMKDLYS